MTDSHTHDPKVLPPEMVEQQMGDYAAMLADDPVKAAAALKAWEDSGLIITLPAIQQAVVIAVAPILEQVQEVHRTQLRVAEGLVAFRTEVLDLLNEIKGGGSPT